MLLPTMRRRDAPIDALKRQRGECDPERLGEECEMTPTARSLDLLRRTGHIAGVVERFIAAVNRRSDLFGFADLIAVHRVEPGVLLLQATTRTNVSARLAKAKSKPELAVWLRNGGRFQVWGWYLAAGRWQVKRVEVRGDDLRDVVHEAPRQRRRDREPNLFDTFNGDTAQ
jgi:hypothetical protein